MAISYSERFQQKEAVTAYENKEYGAESYSTRIWQLQRPLVEKTLADFQAAQSKPVQLLDFACGTGRVLACVENFAETADGVDISESMISVARTRCRRARLLVGDVLANPGLLGGKQYDVITCFRLLLNLEPELRGRILERLRQSLRPGGLLVVNIHGNSRSLRHPAIRWRRWREKSAKTDAMLNEMSPGEAEKLLAATGFSVLHRAGFGMMPPGLYKTPLRSLAFGLDRLLAGQTGWSAWSVDILYVCRPV